MTRPSDVRARDMNQLMTDCKVFWAFSKEQFKEGASKLEEADGKTLVDIGAGGYMPKVYKYKYINGMKKIALDFKQSMQDEKERKAHVLYELYNHEAFYTGNIETTLDALGEDFTRAEVLQAYDGRRKANQ